MMTCQRQIGARSGFESRWEHFLRNQALVDARGTDSNRLLTRAVLIRSRSLTGKAAGLYPASAGSARDPSSNLGGSIEITAGVAQAAERLTVNQIVAGSSPATRPEVVGMSSNWQDGSL